MASRNVQSYIKAVQRLDKLAAKLAVKDSKLDGLRGKVRDAKVVVQTRLGKLTGGQMAEAEKILDTFNEGKDGDR